MATEGMNVNYEGLRQSASVFRKEVTNMNAALDEATSNIDRTTNSWQSQAANDLRERFKALSTKFEDFYNAINNYAQFLDNTANAYEAADKKIEQRADELLNNDYNGAAQ